MSIKGIYSYVEYCTVNTHREIKVAYDKNQKIYILIVKKYFFKFYINENLSSTPMIYFMINVYLHCVCIVLFLLCNF